MPTTASTTVNGSPLMVWVLPSAPTPPCAQIIDTGSSQNTRPGIHRDWSRLDCCNSLLVGVSHSLIQKVQSVQNAAAWLLTGTRCGDHISSVLRQLHWLPVQRQVDVKLAYFVFSSLSGQAPPYLADDIHLILEGPRCRLHSSVDRLCAVPRTHNTFSNCCCRATHVKQPPYTLT